MPKKHSQSRITDNKGNARIAAYCANHKPQLTWRKIIDDDIGLDGEIEIYDENYHPLAEIFKVQLKSTESDKGYIKGESDKHHNFTFYAEKSHVDYWQNLPLDVLLIVFDGRNDATDLYAKVIEGFDLTEHTSDKVPIIFDKRTDLIVETQGDFLSRFSKTLGDRNVLFQKFLPNLFIPDLRYFAGRVDLLKNVEAELKRSHRVSIHDISGLGKTFSTLEYARRNHLKYDKVFFINASKDGYLESMANCGELLNPSVKSAREQLVKVNAFKHWLEENNNWLVIFDNVDIAADVKPFVPNNLKGDCLFTSNFRDVERIGNNVAIAKLDKIDSKILLYSISNAVPLQKPVISDKNEAKAFDKIIEEIDGLPISLTTTGAFIFKKDITFAEYLERLKDEPEIILAAEDDFGIYHKKSALKAFSIAFAENTTAAKPVARQKLYADAVKILYFAAGFLAPDDIHEEFLRQFLEKHSEQFQNAEKKTAFWQDVRAKFAEYDLFKYNQHDKTFRTHRLIQKTIQTKLTADEKKTICGQVLELLIDYFPKYDYNNKEQCEKYYQHTVSALENADKLFESEDSKTLYDRTARYQELLGNYQQAELDYQCNLEISKRFYGQEHNKTAESLNNLAVVYDLQGKYDEAIELYLEAIEIDKKTIGIEHPNYAIRLNNLAMVYKAQGKNDEAINLLLEAIEIGKKTIGIEHSDYATRLNNLASVYEAQGKYDEALELIQGATKIRKKTIGVEHPDYAVSLWWIATINYKQEKYQDALPLYEEALQIYEAKLPENHPYIQRVREHLMRCKLHI